MFGPDRDGYCPCGSKRRSRFCHARRDGTWAIPERPALLSGPRTGYSNPACYGAPSNDCSELLSKEHWVSANILESITVKSTFPGQFNVRGLRWQGDKQTRVSVKSMQSKVLCTRHNHALSPLDAEAGEMFRVIQHYQRALDSEHPINLFAIFDGPSIERWLIKFLLGGMASGSLGLPDRVKAELQFDINLEILLESLFRRPSVVPEWTLYQYGQTDALFKPGADIEYAIYYDPESFVTGCDVAIGNTCLMLAFKEISSFLVPAGTSSLRPAGFVTRSAITDAQTIWR